MTTETGAMSDKPPILDYRTPKTPREKMPLVMGIIYGVTATIMTLLAGVCFLFGFSHSDGITFVLGLVIFVTACYSWTHMYFQFQRR